MSIDYERKILALTNREMFEAFTRMIEGLAITGVEVRLIELENPQFK